MSPWTGGRACIFKEFGRCDLLWWPLWLICLVSSFLECDPHITHWQSLLWRRVSVHISSIWPILKFLTARIDTNHAVADPKQSIFAPSATKDSISHITSDSGRKFWVTSPCMVLCTPQIRKVGVMPHSRADQTYKESRQGAVNLNGSQ